MPIQQSICFPMFRPADLELDTYFASVKKIGYDAVEFWGRDSSFDDIIKFANQHGLAIASMSGHDSLPDGLNKRSNHDRIEEELIESIDLAAKHNIPGLICFSGNRQPYQSEEDALDATAEGLRRAAPHAEAKGVNLNLELLNSKINHPGYQCDHTAWGVAVCERVNSPNVKLLYDIYHMQIMEGDIIRTMRENLRWIGHIHTAGNPGRNDLNDTQELNYRGICQAISDMGYEYYVGHELKPLGDPMATLKETFDICNV